MSLGSGGGSTAVPSGNPMRSAGGPATEIPADRRRSRNTYETRRPLRPPCLIGGLLPQSEVLD